MGCFTHVSLQAQASPKAIFHDSGEPRLEVVLMVLFVSEVLLSLVLPDALQQLLTR